MVSLFFIYLFHLINTLRDACVPYTDAIGWTQSLGLPTKAAWHPWTYTSVGGNANQVAGYATVYDVTKVSTTVPKIVGANGNSFTFVTVRGGRHEVPTTAPGQAFDLIKRLFANTGF